MDIYNKSTENAIDWIIKKNPGKKIGFTCSCFDILHSGHVLMLKDASSQCDILVIGLQTDPTIDRPEKNKPIQSYDERLIMVQSIKYIDYILQYATEDDLLKILNRLNPSVRIIGSDWKGKKYTGYDLPIQMYWHNRTHNWSSSGLRKRIYEAEKEKNKS